MKLLRKPNVIFYFFIKCSRYLVGTCQINKFILTHKVFWSASTIFPIISIKLHIVILSKMYSVDAFNVQAVSVALIF